MKQTNYLSLSMPQCLAANTKLSGRQDRSSVSVMKLTCFSCAHTLGGCELPGWPNARLEDCPKAEYEPGSDEGELRGSPQERLEEMRRALKLTDNQ